MIISKFWKHWCVTEKKILHSGCASRTIVETSVLVIPDLIGVCGWLMRIQSSMVCLLMPRLLGSSIIRDTGQIIITWLKMKPSWIATFITRLINGKIETGLKWEAENCIRQFGWYLYMLRLMLKLYSWEVCSHLEDFGFVDYSSNYQRIILLYHCHHQLALFELATERSMKWPLIRANPTKMKEKQHTRRWHTLLFVR